MTKNNFPIYLSLATVFGILIGVFINGNNAGFSLNSNTKNEAKIRRLMDYIDQNYVDTINTTNLLDSAISEMIGKLDPHSAYIPKEDLQDIQDRMQGKGTKGDRRQYYPTEEHIRRERAVHTEP